jgi:predicted cupin superfamily sugar epimerase
MASRIPQCAEEIISALSLQPHPEGGHFRETFRAGQTVSVEGKRRAAATSIYYLLADGAYSAWHRIDADETWYFHAGGILLLHVLQEDGELVTHRLGSVLTEPGAVFQATVPARCWFAAELANAGDFALVGCAVAPGFEFSGFELATAKDMADAIQRHGSRLPRLFRKGAAPC